LTTPIAAVAKALLVFFTLVSVPGVRAEEIAPGTDWCAKARALPPGAELVLRPGDYEGLCSLNRGGTPEAPLVIRGQDPARPPRIVYHGVADNVINIRAGHITLRGLHFGPTARNIDAVKVIAGDGVTIEDCRFEAVGGIAIAANGTSVQDLTVRGNEITDSRATAMYFGCHDGGHCALAGLLVERNFIHGVDVPDPEIGYGIQVKLNSTGTIRDNVITDTKGPGIMVYGAHDVTRSTVVEGNFVAGSRTSSALVVGGGPALVRNNIGVSSAEAGIALEDYGHRGLLREIVVVHNTVFANRKAGISAPPDRRVEARIINNAVHARTGTPALPPARPGLLLAGNANCAALACFRDAEHNDFSLLLPGIGIFYEAPWMPTHDYFGRLRAAPPTPGAIEGLQEPIALRLKAAPP